MYTEIFDGLRSYYARYPSRRDAAGFHAAMTMSFLACIALTAILTLGDYFATGNVRAAALLYENKLGLLAVGAAIAFGHVQFGKHTGRYGSKEPNAPKNWKVYLSVYACVVGILVVGAVVVAAMN